MNINVIGLDIAKQTFHLVGLDHTGKQVLKKKLSRSKTTCLLCEPHTL